MCRKVFVGFFCFPHSPEGRTSNSSEVQRAVVGILCTKDCKTNNKQSVCFLPLKYTQGTGEERQRGWVSSTELPVTGSLSKMRQHPKKKTLKKTANKQKYLPRIFCTPKMSYLRGKWKDAAASLSPCVQSRPSMAGGSALPLAQLLCSHSPQWVICALQKNDVWGFLGSLQKEVMGRLLSLSPCGARSAPVHSTQEFHTEKMAFMWCAENVTAIPWFCRIS